MIKTKLFGMFLFNSDTVTCSKKNKIPTNISFVFIKKTCLGESVLMSTHNLCLEQQFFSEKFQFLVVKLTVYLNRLILIMFRYRYCISINLGFNFINISGH